MGIHYNQTNIHWNYFLAIENDFEKVTRYIELTKENDKTFSIELARIIMASTQEIDGIMKKLCMLLDNSCDPKNIGHYEKVIKSKLPDFIFEKAHMPRFGMASKPWSNWSKTKDSTPLWWTANNKIKHDRTHNFEQANLKNAYNAVGALLITTLYYYKSEFQRHSSNALDWTDVTLRLSPKSSLFVLNEDYYHSPVLAGKSEW